jgi:ion channel-forming bestrophin family protein
LNVGLNKSGNDHHARTFWHDALAIRGSVTLRVLPRVLAFGLYALFLYELDKRLVDISIGVEVAPYEVAGAALGLLLVLRTNAGYERWWEARKLWGAIVNQSRNLAIAALAYGPADPSWRDRVVRWTIAFAHASRHSLRGERTIPKIAALLGAETAAEIAASEHMPDFVSLRLAEILHEGYDHLAMDRFAFLQAEQARFLLMDDVGGCERILKTPLPQAYAISIRRFILLFFATLPFALLDRVEALAPIVTVLVAYPILSLDDIGTELQNPFSTRNVGHLALDQVCETIEGNLLALLGTNPQAASDSMLEV